MIMRAIDVDGDEFIIDVASIACLKETSDLRVEDDKPINGTKKYWLYTKYENLYWELTKKEFDSIKQQLGLEL